ncbi:YolD-like family protein [Pontibacillus litoralis]|uniref:YolD-like family protein n=1 Tax=Pontibacillus litoralis TaxID=516703 RepID=UPI00056283BF|nr:YolD-like family protein [Pontibacillus litoralis]
MSLKDRGTIKWTSLMLPEHVSMLRNIWEEEQQHPLPSFDEQKLAEMNHTIMSAYHQQQSVTFISCQNGNPRQYTGIITQLDEKQSTIRLRTIHQEYITIPLHTITQIN